jgi:hypothetical protein
MFSYSKMVTKLDVLMNSRRCSISSELIGGAPPDIMKKKKVINIKLDRLALCCCWFAIALCSRKIGCGIGRTGVGVAAAAAAACPGAGGPGRGAGRSPSCGFPESVGMVSRC